MECNCAQKLTPFQNQHDNLPVPKVSFLPLYTSHDWFLLANISQEPSVEPFPYVPNMY